MLSPRKSHNVIPNQIVTNVILRKLDRWLLPVLFSLQFLNHLDRSNLANAKLDLQPALSLSQSEYGFATSVYQIGNLIAEVPANMILRKSRASCWIGGLVVAFGLVAGCTAFATDFVSLIAIRFALGVAESGVAPGVLAYMAYWYRPEELGLRNALFLVAGTMSNAVGALLAYVILQLNILGLVGWQWLFLLEGLPAVLAGIFAMFYLPDHPSTCRWFSGEMRSVALERVPLQTPARRREGQGWKALVRLLTSPVIWCFALLNICTNITSYGIGAFLPAIIAEMGYTSIAANLRASPVYFWQGVVTLLGAWISDRYRNRGWVMVVCLFMSGSGMFLLAIALYSKWSLEITYLICFLLVSYGPCSPIMLAWAQEAYSDSSEASVGPALVLAIGTFGAFLGPNIYGTTSDGESYTQGHLIMGCVFWLGSMIAATMTLVFIKRGGVLGCRRCGEQVLESVPLVSEERARTSF